MKATIAIVALIAAVTGCMTSQAATETATVAPPPYPAPATPQPAATPTPAAIPAPAAATPSTMAMPAEGKGMAGMAMANSDPDHIIADGGVKVAGWMGRVDPRAETQGRKITEASFVSMGSGMHVTAGPAAIYWNAANSPSGNYTVKATFNQTKASTHPEGYGLIAAGRDLTTPNQSYAYFLVRQDGKYLINHRAGDSTVHKIVDWTANPAVKAVDASGKASNTLAIRVDATNAHFMINGTEVHSMPRGTLEMGSTSPSNAGIAGIRVNHNLDVHIDGFGVTTN
ncbi:MAG: hypothetical protein ABIS03_09250 [Gemmatimonadaceae bacterium]